MNIMLKINSMVYTKNDSERLQPISILRMICFVFNLNISNTVGLNICILKKI